MRIDKLILHKNICDPKTYGGSTGAVTSGHVEKTIENYDLYLVGDDFYVVRDQKYVAVVKPQGTAYIRGEDGARKAAWLAGKFPRPEPEKKDDHLVAPASASTS